MEIDRAKEESIKINYEDHEGHRRRSKIEDRELRRTCDLQSSIFLSFVLFVSFVVYSIVRCFDQSFGDVLIGVNAAVTQEGPVRALDIKPVEVAFGDDDLFSFDSRFGDELARWIAHKTLAPEINAVRRIAFMARSIGHRYINAVGDGVAALNRFPG